MKNILIKSIAVFACFFLSSYSEAVTYDPSDKLKTSKRQTKNILRQEKKQQQKNLDRETKRPKEKSKALEKENTRRKNAVGQNVLKESQWQTEYKLRQEKRQQQKNLKHESYRLKEKSQVLEYENDIRKNAAGQKVLKASQKRIENILNSSKNTTDLILLKERERQKNEHRKAAGDTYIAECRWPLKEDGTCMTGWNDIKNIRCNKGYFNVMIVGGVDGGIENAGGMPYAAIEKWTCRICPIGFYCPGNGRQYECPEALSSGMTGCPK